MPRGDEAYAAVCRRVPRLCPRLVPEPLWGVSLARLARADPEAVCGALGEGEECTRALEALAEWWLRAPRGPCSVCGAPASHLDEDWRYYAEGGVGVAVLARVRPLCDPCHLAKHLGYAMTRGRYEEALEHLARVNGVRLVDASAAAEEAFRVWRRLSSLEEWRVRVEAPEVPESLGGAAERVLDSMARAGYSLWAGWLWFSERPTRAKEVLERASAETAELLEAALGASVEEASGILAVDPGARAATAREAAARLQAAGVRVLAAELEEALRLAAQRARGPGGLLDRLVGKWMVFAPRALRGLVLGLAVGEARARGVAFEAKTSARASKDEEPVLLYVPSMLAPNLVVKAVEALEAAALEAGVAKPLMFKPDVFTEAGIYSGRSSLRPYVYLRAPRRRG